MNTSIFELFKIGIGPSSSHTVGPMRAARSFAADLDGAAVCRIQIELYGSLGLTGRGHGTDRAVLLGLLGEEPDRIDPANIECLVRGVRKSKHIAVMGGRAIRFDEASDLLFRGDIVLPGHPNGMRFTAFDSAGAILRQEVYYSVGGGFIEREGQPQHAAASGAAKLPYPFSSAAEMLAQGRAAGLPIWVMMLENEKALRSESEIRQRIARVWTVMQECTQRGLATEGLLPGGLDVRRRAPELHRKLLAAADNDPLRTIDWINLYAIAVNEENAAGGRVVTAPTNGAAGVIPAVAHYYRHFAASPSEEGIVRYFLAAGAIGILYKENASISGAEVGCQGEVGVACSMAAGGLVAALNGSNEAIEHAAEIGMEHNLGMTCDPIGGLVQIPCIERNAFGAVKAVSAARMAMTEEGGHKVTLDQVIRTMYQTGLDMRSRYKETSLGGLAVNVIEC
ncbi:MAG TPA: L-serine ammonia-lyase [Bryobacteraceae bacterium]|nr:L-serine ammonia-lyase [Bryobacteraceae bacterium]